MYSRRLISLQSDTLSARVSHEPWGSVRGASTFSEMQILTFYVCWRYGAYIRYQKLHTDTHTHTVSQHQTACCWPLEFRFFSFSPDTFGAKIHAIRPRLLDLSLTLSTIWILRCLVICPCSLGWELQIWHTQLVFAVLINSQHNRLNFSNSNVLSDLKRHLQYLTISVLFYSYY